MDKLCLEGFGGDGYFAGVEKQKTSTSFWDQLLAHFTQFVDHFPSITPNAPQVTPKAPQVSQSHPKSAPCHPKVTPKPPQVIPTAPQVTPKASQVTPKALRVIPKASGPQRGGWAVSRSAATISIRVVRRNAALTVLTWCSKLALPNPPPRRHLC